MNNRDTYLVEAMVSLDHPRNLHEKESLLVYYRNYAVKNGMRMSSWAPGAA
jgi:hypothetical protein